MSEDSDEDLYLKISDESQRAFRLLYDRHSGPLFRFIFRFTGNRQATEDILHDVFLQVLNGQFHIGSESNLKGWLYTVARNKCLNHKKKLANESAKQHLISDENHDTDIETKFIERNNITRLAVAINTLPGDLRATWELRKQGLDYRQIARQLEIPVGTVKSRFYRLVEFLREELGI